MSITSHSGESLYTSLRNFVLSGCKLVDQNVANVRAETCSTCHNNKIDPSQKSCCGKGIIESAVSLTIRTAIVGSRVTDSNKKLGKCEICGCPNNLTVWFPSNPLGVNEENKNAYPSFCWKKEII